MIEEFLRLVGFGLCHQLPERSFFGAGYQVPVCARDTGIYAGFLIAVVVLLLLDRGRRSSELPPIGGMVVLGVFLLAMAVDGVTSYGGWRETTNEIRLLTGLAAGYAIAALSMPMLNGQLWKRPGGTRLLGTGRETIAFVASLLPAYALVWWVGPLLGLLYPLLTVGAIIFTFTYVNAVIVALLPVFERKASTVLMTWPVCTVALVLTVLELAGSAAFKAWLVRLTGVVL